MDCGASINYLKSAILNFLDLDLKPKEVIDFKVAAKKLAKLDFEALFKKEYQGKDLIEFLNLNLGSIFSNSIGTETNLLKLGGNTQLELGRREPWKNFKRSWTKKRRDKTRKKWIQHLA